MMALTAGRLTGRPGICFVTRGPGATNAAHGVHIAEHDSAPMILFVGQVERAMSGRGAFQEMDYRAFFGSTTKWATEIANAARIPEVVQRAYHIAMQGRPGPVVIALPEDVLVETASVADAPRAEAAAIWPGQTQMAELQKMLWTAERPIAHRRRRGLDREGQRERPALRRAIRSAGRGPVPARQRARRRAPQLRRRDRHRRQSEAQGAHRTRRSRAADRRSHVGGGLARLYAVRHSRAAAATGSRSRRCQRNRPQLSSLPRDRRDLAGFRGGPGGRATAGLHPMERRDPPGPRGLSRLERTGAGCSGTRATERGDVRAAAARPRRHIHDRRRQLRDLGRALPPVSPDRTADRADLGLDGLRPAGRDRREAAVSRVRPSSASPATAIS